MFCICKFIMSVHQGIEISKHVRAIRVSMEERAPRVHMAIPTLVVAIWVIREEIAKVNTLCCINVYVLRMLDILYNILHESMLFCCWFLQKLMHYCMYNVVLNVSILWNFGVQLTKNYQWYCSVGVRRNPMITTDFLIMGHVHRFTAICVSLLYQNAGTRVCVHSCTCVGV